MSTLQINFSSGLSDQLRFRDSEDSEHKATSPDLTVYVKRQQLLPQLRQQKQVYHELDIHSRNFLS